MTFVILSIISTIIFLIGSGIKYGMTRSWSAIYYKLKDDEIEELFLIAMILISLPLIIAAGLVTESVQDIWGTIALAISGTMIIFSGLAADARNNEITERNHVLGATGGMIMAGLGSLLWGLWIPVLFMLIGSSVMFIIKFRDHTHYIESYVYIWTIIMFLIKFGIL